MRLSPEQFRNWDRKSVTLMGMSGVGKTRLSNLLRRSDWFHYSGDYRIGTRYLDEAILDTIKEQAMSVPMLRDLLHSDSIFIRSNVTFHNLNPVSTFLGMLGDPELGGLSLTEFKRRQNLHRQAEIAAMYDVPAFMRKAKLIYGYNHFINDVGGSLCELDEPGLLEFIDEHSLILYIRASEKDEQSLIARSVSHPKPLYYREAFLDQQLAEYMEINDVDYVSLIKPNDFTRWVFPKLFRARIPRYESIAAKYGYTVNTHELAQVNSEADFLTLLEQVIERES
ncbi:ATPase [Candidatus Thiodiazotropha endoloripes]|uniref:ATPase n=1 Tax=Candidatus Thiodiazotropha endoloripes TaxID=1818881 RepID=UPI00083DB093|nr:ATPase [Candidatus Thiodiazotropha endoloripes]MCG7902659.1 ATPase [Candidatus Thiodiazotropha weberae]MCG7913430.1 ATPase [Candidatus Thiodiazotropha weberae]ODB86346.1 ATPase [Candidatus Thiodiazotropha endoloripes]ODB88377.1 ATPase [Candidatus Thiodiazotropha endoloripes]ODB89826.1 ATPase [Candidatus Thiodiazotropha endoloripes]